MSEKDIAFIRNQFPNEGALDVILALPCQVVEKGRGSQRKLVDRIVGISEVLHIFFAQRTSYILYLSQLRVILVKSGVMGRSVSTSFLITSIKSIARHTEDGLAIAYNFYNLKMKELELIRLEIVASSAQNMQKLLSGILTAIHQLQLCGCAQRIELANIPQPKERIHLSDFSKFSLSYKVYCAFKNKTVEPAIIEEVRSMITWDQKVIDIPYLLHSVLVAKKQSKKKQIEAEDVYVILRALNRVSSFTACHLGTLEKLHGALV